MKDAVATMGMELPAETFGRDAVHVAVFSAVSPDDLRPGDHVGLVGSPGSRDSVVSASVGEEIGIVDPFLSGYVAAGTRFWVYLYPRTITGLVHRWTHDGQDAHGEIPPEFWEHVETVLGRKITGHRPVYFSCSC